jgi:hypothetical protein
MEQDVRSRRNGLASRAEATLRSPFPARPLITQPKESTMHSRVAFPFLIALLGAAPATAQPKIALPSDPNVLVREWYRAYLGREADPAGAASWVNTMRKGNSPQQTLAKILGGPEYRVRTGGTPEGFVRGFFLDATGREPTGQELQAWVNQFRRGKPDDVAEAMIKAYPQALLPTVAQKAPERQYLGGAQEQVRDLIAEVERLQEDISVELRGRKDRALYLRADAVLGELRHLSRVLKPGYNREHIYRDFTSMDKQLHALLDGVDALGESRILKRGAFRVRQADRQLHFVLSIGDTSAGRGKEVIREQLEALDAEARELNRAARYALANQRGAERLLRDIDAFSEEANHTLKSVVKGLDRDHVKDDLVRVHRTWGRVVEGLNALPPQQGTYALRRRAQSVDRVEEQLHSFLGVKGDRTRVIVPYNRPGR